MQDNELMSIAQFYEALRDAVRKAGSQVAFATQAGVSPAYVSDVLNARRDPGDSILKAVGLKKVIRYKRIG